MANQPQTPTERGFDEGHVRKAMKVVFPKYTDAEIEAEIEDSKGWPDGYDEAFAIAQLIADTERATRLVVLEEIQRYAQSEYDLVSKRDEQTKRKLNSHAFMNAMLMVVNKCIRLRSLSVEP